MKRKDFHYIASESYKLKVSLEKGHLKYYVK